MIFKQIASLAAFTIVLLGLSVQPARADALQLILDHGNSAISGYAGPYASVNINRIDTTHAIVTFSRLGSFLLGAQGIGAVNVNAGSWTVGNFGSSGLVIDLSNGGAKNEGGYGKFNQTFDNAAGFTHAVTSFNFTLTNTSGRWANAGSVLKKNEAKYSVAAHIFVPNATGTAALATGYAAVPDGGTTATLLGLLLTAGALVARRKR